MRVGDFQHCIVITRGQEERIPKTASVVGTKFCLRSFSLCLCVFLFFVCFESLLFCFFHFLFFYFHFSFFWRHKNQKPIITTIRSLVDRGGGIWDFQHCIVITRGQEERIPKWQTLWELTLALGRFPFDFEFFEKIVFFHRF